MMVSDAQKCMAIERSNPMKKLVSLLLAALMLLSSRALFESYTMNEDSFISEQGPVWFYRCYSEEEDAIKDLNLADPALGWGDNWQFSLSRPWTGLSFHVQGGTASGHARQVAGQSMWTSCSSSPPQGRQGHPGAAASW